jgi:hypothetical protein
VFSLPHLTIPARENGAPIKRAPHRLNTSTRPQH